MRARAPAPFVGDRGRKAAVRTAPARDDGAPDGYIYAAGSQAAAMGRMPKKGKRPPAGKAKGALRGGIATCGRRAAEKPAPGPARAAAAPAAAAPRAPAAGPAARGGGDGGEA